MNFRPIRIALNLSLIVAMTSQPMLALGLCESKLGRHAAKQQQCQGCRCCAIEPAEDQCCCCSAEGSHIIRTDVDRRDVDGAEAKDGVAELQFATACHCGITRLPMDRRHHRQSKIDFSKLRVGNLLVVDLLSESDPKSFHLQPAWRGDANRLGRYSQQYLCVWRI